MSGIQDKVILLTGASSGIGAATALLTVVSGALYARLGAQGFWVMAGLCALAFPLTWKLRQAVGESRAQAR